MFSCPIKSNKKVIYFMILLFGIPINIQFVMSILSVSIQDPFIAYALQTIILVIITLYFLDTYSWSKIGFVKVPPLQSVCTVLGLFICTNIFLAFLYSIFGDIWGLAQQESHLDIFGDSLMQKIGLFILAVLIAPLLEEIIFRGIIFPFLLTKMSPFWSIIVNGFIFGFMHFEFQSGIALSIIGMSLAYLTYKTKSIIPSIIYHAINNALAVMVEIFVN